MKQQLKTFPDGYYVERIGGPVEASVTTPYLRVNGKWEMFSSFQWVFEERVQKIDSFLELLNSQVSQRDKKDLCLRL
jgi:hypothetical protein